MKKFIKFICYFLVFIVLIVGLYTVKESKAIRTVEFRKPALLSSDYDMITYNNKQYIKLENPPKDLTPILNLNMNHWIGVRIDGQSKRKQYYGRSQALEMRDKENNSYLWLLIDYDEIHTDNGEDKSYSDFDNPTVYKLVDA